ncbi:DUF4244 domain-containing protein [Streptomyces sp. AV19]|nr:DUF4244 domain-containing protein [Streptomyces sp. AV19]
MVMQWWTRAKCRAVQAGEAGMSTAEYAVGIAAACALAAVLYKVESVKERQ